MKIKDLPKIDRPREKLEKYGPERLSDSELLAILLRTGSEGVNVVELSSKILQEIKREIISVGSLNANLVHPREVFEPAVRHLAAQVIVAHNHPAGDLEPSDHDIEITKRLKDAGEVLGIDLIDHIIVTKDSFTSFKEKQLL